MKVLISFLFILFFTTSSFAQVINSEFKPSQDISHIKEGDLIEATLRFWPIENADLNQFKQLEKNVLFNAFYFAQLVSLGTSPNNADVVEIKGIFVVKSAKPQPLFVFKYNTTPIEMHLEGLKIDELKNKSDQFIILDQSVTSSKIWMIIAGALLLLVILAIIKRQKLLELLKGLKPDAAKKSRKKYDELFRTANHREDFERIYRDRGIWLSLLENKAPAHNDFFKVLNQYQYKKDWSNEDYNEVRSSFDIIRRSFEK